LGGNILKELWEMIIKPGLIGGICLDIFIQISDIIIALFNGATILFQVGKKWAGN